LSLIVVVEGDTDLPVVRKLAHDAGLSITAELDQAGKARLDDELTGYNAAAKGSPWLVLRDLDHDAPCAGRFLAEREFSPAPWMCFRLAVRELEAWLLADAHGMAGFLRVDEGLLPRDPDAERDPTETLVRLARRSGSSALRKALIPKPGSSVTVGPLYEAKIIEFAERHWELARACERSASLRRARAALRSMAAKWSRHVQGQ
jgi:hypothetical protein